MVGTFLISKAFSPQETEEPKSLEGEMNEKSFLAMGCVIKIHYCL